MRQKPRRSEVEARHKGGRSGRPRRRAALKAVRAPEASEPLLGIPREARRNSDDSADRRARRETGAVARTRGQKHIYTYYLSICCMSPCLSTYPLAAIYLPVYPRPRTEPRPPPLPASESLCLGRIFDSLRFRPTARDAFCS